MRLGCALKLGPNQLALARKLVGEGRPVREVVGVLVCHRATLHRALGMADGPAGSLPGRAVRRSPGAAP